MATEHSFWMAFAALIISLLNLAWNVFSTFFKLPRLHVLSSLNVEVHVGTLPTGEVNDITYTPVITVINTGGEAATVADVGLRDSAAAILVSVERSRAAGREIEGDELPARIEAHGQRSWSIPNDLLANIERGTPFWAYASNVRPLRWWHPKGRSHFRFYVGRNSLMLGR